MLQYYTGTPYRPSGFPGLHPSGIEPRDLTMPPESLDRRGTIGWKRSLWMTCHSRQLNYNRAVSTYFWSSNLNLNMLAERHWSILMDCCVIQLKIIHQIFPVDAFVYKALYNQSLVYIILYIQYPPSPPTPILLPIWGPNQGAHCWISA